MRIVDLSFIVLSVPLPKPVETSFGVMSRRTNALIRVETDQGLVGLGETWTNFPHWAAEERRLTVAEGLKPLVVGLDPLNIPAVWERLSQGLLRAGAGRQWGAPGPLYQALSGLDVALWDILGQHLNAPIYQLFGGLIRDKVPAYASGLGPRDFEPLVAAAQAKGYRAFKLKVGFGRDADLANLALMRRLVGDGARLMIDANQAWPDATTALNLLRKYQDFDLEFIEEPVPAGQLADLRAIREKGPLPVAGGENLYGRAAFVQALAAQALDILQPDVTKSGGLSECRLACQMAEAHGLKHAPHMFGTALGLAASLHILAATPGGLIMEVDATPNLLLTDLVKESFFRFEDGSFVLDGRRPGLGVEINDDLVREYQV